MRWPGIGAVSASLAALNLGFRVVGVVDKTCRRLPFVERARGAALDTLFGPEEHYDYVSTTAPPTPPPTYK